MRKEISVDMWRMMVLLLLALASLFSVAAANNPGHDSLYVLKLGDSNVTGSINLSSALNASNIYAASIMYGNYLDIRANSTILAVSSRPAVQADSSNLYLDSPGAVYLNTKGGTTSVVQVGPTTGSSIVLNISGTIKQQNVNVCLQNGTNCPAMGSGTVSSGTANKLAYYTGAGTSVGSLAGANNGAIYYDGSGNVQSATLPVASGGTGTTTSTGSGSVVLSASPTLTGTLAAATITASGAVTGASGGSGDAFVIGNDAKLSDINVANTVGVYGLQNSSIGSIRLGSGGGTISGDNGNIGIGTTNPGYKLHVVNTATGGAVLIDGSGTSDQLALEPQATFHRIAFNELRFWDWEVGADMVVLNNGSVGIGDTNPASKLSVTGNISASGKIYAEGSQVCTAANGLCMTGSSSAAGWTNTTTQTTTTLNVGIGSAGAPSAKLHAVIVSTNPTRPSGTWAGIIENTVDSAGNNGLAVATRWGIGTSTVFEAASYWNGASEVYTPILTVKGDRNVGIGTTNPGAKLEVNGTIKTSNDVGTSLNLGREDNANEGGQMVFTGAGSYDGWYLDLYQNNMRAFTGSGNTNTFQIMNSGAGVANLNVEGSVTAASFSGSGSGLTGTANSLTAAAIVNQGALATVNAVSGGNAGTITDGTITAADLASGDFSSKITSGTYSISVSGTAGSLAANPTNCGAGQYAAGIDASGNAEGCAAPSVTNADTVDNLHGTQFVRNDADSSFTAVYQSFNSGSVFDLGAVATDYPANAGWAGTWNANMLLSGLDYTTISWHDSGCCVGALGYTGNKFFVDGAGSWGPVSFGINTRNPSAALDVQGNMYLGNGGSFSNGEGWDRVIDMYSANHVRYSARANTIDTRLLSHTGTYGGVTAGGSVGTASSHPFGIMTAGTNRMYFDTSGNVGIGAAPSAMLHLSRTVSGGSYPAILFQTSATGKSRIGSVLNTPRLDMYTNLYYNGSAWVLDDTANAGAGITINPTGNEVFRIGYSPAAANPITYQYMMVMTNNGNSGFGTTTTSGRVTGVGGGTGNIATGGTYTGGGQGHPPWGWGYSTIQGAGAGDAYCTDGSMGGLYGNCRYGGGAGGVFNGAVGGYTTGGGAGVSAIGGDGGYYAEGGAGIYAKGGANGAWYSGAYGNPTAPAGYFDGRLVVTGFPDFNYGEIEIQGTQSTKAPFIRFHRPNEEYGQIRYGTDASHDAVFYFRNMNGNSLARISAADPVNNNDVATRGWVLTQIAGPYWAYRSATCSSGWGAQCTATATCPSGTTIQAYRALDAGCGGGTPSHAVGSLDNTGGCSLGGTSCSKTTSYCSEQQIVAAVGIICSK